MNPAPDLLVIDPRDNVATAVRALQGGQAARVGAAPGAGSASSAGGDPLRLLEAIPIYHKVALRDIPAGQVVLKYGQSIGTALRDIRAGEHVHVHNLAGRRAAGETARGRPA